MYKHKESTWKIDSNNNYEEVNEFIEKKIKKLKTTREDLTSIESLFFTNKAFGKYNRG